MTQQLPEQIENWLLQLAQDEEGDGGDEGGVGSSTQIPRSLTEPSIPADETERMAVDRHSLEQEGHRKFAKVNAREKPVDVPGDTPNYDQGLKEHPLLQSQRFDGIDTTVNPVPALSTDARREYDNIRREQELQKQMRLGNDPRMGLSAAPKPSR